VNKLDDQSAALPAPVFLDQADDWPIAYRPYGLEGPNLPVLMLHGIESHSGWFTRSAAYIAGLGHPVYAMDRRGSGASDAPRGMCTSYQEMLADVEVLARSIMSAHQCSQVHLLGHCFGAIPATAFACMHPALLKSLSLSTPAIYTKEGPAMGDKLKIFWSVLSGRDQRIPVSLTADLFSDLPEFVRFINNDKLTLKNASTRLYWEAVQARKYIHANERQLTMPIFMALAGKDRICDDAKDQHFFDRVPSLEKQMRSYPDAVHILEFSRNKDQFFTDLAHWLQPIESG
jgi:acylglycerol lipase